VLFVAEETKKQLQEIDRQTGFSAAEKEDPAQAEASGEYQMVRSTYDIAERQMRVV
jgi:hypothetical protein